MITENHDRRPVTILAVDDEVRTLRGLKETMPWAEWGIDEVLTASDAARARALFNEAAPSILLTDIRMPRTDGFTLASELRALRPSLPVIFMSAYGDVGHLHRAFQLRPIDFLLKPIDAADLQSATARARAEIERLPRFAEPPLNRAPDPAPDAHRLDAIIVDRICRHIVEGDAVSADELALQWDEVAHADRVGWYVCLATLPDATPTPKDEPDRSAEPGSASALNVVGTAAGPDARISIVSVTGISDRPDAESIAGGAGLDPHDLLFASEAYRSISPLPAVAAERLRARGASSRYVQDAQRFMRSRFADPLTIDDIARAVYLTPSYICRLFKEKTGITVKEFLVRERIHRARLTIARGDYYELADVARESGFGTYRYFTASFKRIVGVTPSAYAARRGRS